MVLLLGSVAHAEPVNLLVSAPTTVAVSSTVANARIIPEHLVDGKLSTAWNSKTGELVGAWIAVRVPSDATVKMIKLTAGFSHTDKSGDLFTMNPRIKKVRVSRAGKVLVEQALDPDNRGLQTIAVDVPGGDLEVRVLEILPGSKPSWKEICVSEIEVWGTLAASAKVVKSRPALRVGSLDAAPTLTREQCQKAVFPDARGGRIGPERTDESITAIVATPFSADIAICRVDHAERGSVTTTSEIAAVRLGAHPSLLGQITETIKTEERPRDGGGDKGEIALEVFPLTATERGLLVHVTQSEHGPMLDQGTTTSSLYRVSGAALTRVLEFTSTWSDGEANDADRCTLEQIATPGKSLPTLTLDCVKEEGRWHGQDPRGNGKFETHRTKRFRFKAGVYEPK